MGMNKRKRRLLQAITIDYINTAEPVGSRTIAKKYNFGVSPATIRNEMADLEEEGYLKQPHTSAGRIPSDKGYRFYVDSLMRAQPLSDSEREYILKYFSSKREDLEEVIREASKLIADMSKYVSLAIGPFINEARFKHLEMVPLTSGKVLVIIVVEPGFVENRVIELDNNINSREIMIICKFLNETLSGRTIREINTDLLKTIDSEMKMHKKLFEGTMNLLMKGLKTGSSGRLHISGAANLFEHPEFKDIDRAKTLLKMLQTEDALAGLLQPGSSGLKVLIGQENISTDMKDCGVITASFKLGNKPLGTIGIVGPTRMNYSRMVSLVEAVTGYLNEFFH